MQFYGYHGVSKFEKDLGGKFEVDVEMTTSFKKACQTDDLRYTIDYEAIYHMVDNCVKEKKYYLIETLADSIAKQILFAFSVDKITIRIRKPHASIQGVLDTVEVELFRIKEDYV